MSVSQVLRGCLFLGVIPLLMAARQAEKPQPAVAAKLCQSCHGAHGEGTPAAGIPRLAGQSADYLDKQLRDYAGGSRDNAIMHQWAIQLKDAQRAEVAAYYASLTSAYAVAPPASAPPRATHRRKCCWRAVISLRTRGMNPAAFKPVITATDRMATARRVRRPT